MKEHRASWILACITILTVDTVLGQAPSAPIVHEPSTSLPQAQGKIRMRVSLVNVPVTVTNGAGELVSNLAAQDLPVTHTRLRQQITYVGSRPTPPSLALFL